MKTFLIAITACAACAAVIPAGRMIDWSNTGVPGGIPHRTEVFRTIDTGGTDASAAINAALAACPEGQVVQLSAGYFNIHSALTFGNRRWITLRGAGMGRTTLRPFAGQGAAITTGQTGFSSGRVVTGGSAKGSRSITVDDASGVAPGLSGLTAIPLRRASILSGTKDAVRQAQQAAGKSFY
jgi:hypothetical protein